MHSQVAICWQIRRGKSLSPEYLFEPSAADPVSGRVKEGESNYKLAQDNNAVNVLAQLMEYKNSHYAGFDPMDEFTLDLI